MAAVGTKLRSYGDTEGKAVGYMHWCPACDEPHGVNVEQKNQRTGAQWTFDGNIEEPTFSPSVRVFSNHDLNGQPLPAGQIRTLCHYFVRRGMIEFCSDSPHSLAGKTLSLPNWPQYTEH